jgi:RNA polymerase sigma factor (sigma-70 family)
MRNSSPPRRAPRLFEAAHPLAARAADVRSAGVLDLLHDAALDRDDVRQEVLLRVWGAISQFERERATLRTFVETVASTTVTSICRRATAKKRKIPLDYIVAESFEISVQVERRVDVQRLFKRLAPADRAVARLLVERGPSQVARQLRISRSAVYRSINRIREALREGGFGQ